MVQWLRLQAPNAGGPGLIPGQGTRSHMPQLRGCILQLKPSAVKLKKKKQVKMRGTLIRLLFWSFIGEFMYTGASLTAQSVKNLPAMQETQV